MANQSVASDKHPKGLYVLFGTEMWERFSFYSMLALFVLYLRDPNEGFGWTATEATSLYANYLMFVYASPLIGGLIADKITGYRNAVLIGGFFFMAGHGLLSIAEMWAVYAALTCLVIGNGFFKPNVSAMVGNLYPEGSPLKDRAYNIFYMGINVGALLAPILMEIVKQYAGFHAAFAVAAFGMVISVAILWFFRNEVESKAGMTVPVSDNSGDAQASTVDVAPLGTANGKRSLIDSVPDWKRITALIVIFLIVIVFWMVFHQNGSTITYWADDNTDWNVTGIISNAINPFWIIVLTFPVVWFWGFLAKRGKEPSTPTKMAFGMTLTALSFFVLAYAASLGEGYKPTTEDLANGEFRINQRVVENLNAAGVNKEVTDKLMEATAKKRPPEPVEEGFVNGLLAWFKGEEKPRNIVDDVKFTADGSYMEALGTIRTYLDIEGMSLDSLEKLQGVKFSKEEEAFEKASFKDQQSVSFSAFIEKVADKMRGQGVETKEVDMLLAYKNASAEDFSAASKLITTAKKIDPRTETHEKVILDSSYLFLVSPFWLLLAYAIISLGELMLSPMGLSLVSKVAPVRMRGILMGGWFVATAIGNKLTAIGIYWSIWYQSNFFLILGLMALVMAVVLFLILKPLKRAMPGV